MNSTARKYENALKVALESGDIIVTEDDVLYEPRFGRNTVFPTLLGALDPSEWLDFFQESVIQHDINHARDFFVAAMAGTSSVASRWVNDAMDRLLVTYEDFLRQEAHDLKQAIALDNQQQYLKGE